MLSLCSGLPTAHGRLLQAIQRLWAPSAWHFFNSFPRCDAPRLQHAVQVLPALAPEEMRPRFRVFGTPTKGSTVTRRIADCGRLHLQSH